MLVNENCALDNISVYGNFHHIRMILGSLQPKWGKGLKHWCHITQAHLFLSRVTEAKIWPQGRKVFPTTGLLDFKDETIFVLNCKITAISWSLSVLVSLPCTVKVRSKHSASDGLPQVPFWIQNRGRTCGKVRVRFRCSRVTHHHVAPSWGWIFNYIGSRTALGMSFPRPEQFQSWGQWRSQEYRTENTCL